MFIECLFYDLNLISNGIDCDNLFKCSANQYADSWGSLKILEYIDMMEETWNKLDVHDPDCQKRIVCELYQNESDLGPTASKFIKIFG